MKKPWTYGSPKKIAWLIGIPIGELKAIAANTEKFYRPFIKEPEGKKARLIDQPVGRLKEIQGRLNVMILKKQLLPACLVGGVSGRDPLDHPRLHVGKKVVVTADVKDCYPSITNAQVFRIWRDRIKCSPDVANLLTKLTTRQGHLPLGAPTSTPLGNLVLEPTAVQIERLLQQYQMDFSQFIDDSAISGQTLQDSTITEVIRIFSRHGFRVGREKVKVMRSGKSQHVTGKAVNQKLVLPMKKRKRITAALHELSMLRPE